MPSSSCRLPNPLLSLELEVGVVVCSLLCFRCEVCNTFSGDCLAGEPPLGTFSDICVLALVVGVLERPVLGLWSRMLALTLFDSSSTGLSFRPGLALAELLLMLKACRTMSRRTCRHSWNFEAVSIPAIKQSFSVVL